MVALLKHTMYCPWHRRLRHSVRVLLIQTFSNVFKSFESPYWSSKYPAYSVCHDVFVQMSVPDTGNSDQLLCLLYAMQPEIEACSYILFSEPLSKGTACHLLSSREKNMSMLSYSLPKLIYLRPKRNPVACSSPYRSDLGDLDSSYINIEQNINAFITGLLSIGVSWV